MIRRLAAGGADGSVVTREARYRVIFLQHQRDVLADRGSELFRNQGEKPGQSHFQPHVVIGKIHKPGCALAEHADPENKAIAAPGFLANSEDTEVMRPGRLQAGFYTARRFLAPEVVGNGDYE